MHAGGDLGWAARWRMARHMAKCPRCRGEVAAYRGLREIVPDLAGIPEVPWNRLAAEMKANIRLGLAAGECVRADGPPVRDSLWFARGRAVVALASAAALLVAGLILQRPTPKPFDTDGEHGLIIAGGSHVHLVEVNPPLAPAVFEALLAAGVLHQDAPHRLGCRAKEVGAILKSPVLRPDQPQPSLMHQRGGLQGLARRFVGHLLRREFTQLHIDQRQEFLRRVLLPGANRLEDLRHWFR